MRDGGPSHGVRVELDNRFLDVNFDGVVNEQDDLNGDGQRGTVLDAAIAEVLNRLPLLPVNVAVGILGRDAAFVDMSPAPGFQLVVDRNADANGNGMSDFDEVLRSLRFGQAGPFTPVSVDPTVTLYEPALDNIREAVDELGTSTTAIIYTDGSGRLPTVRDPLAGFPIAVSATRLGPFQQLVSTPDLIRITSETGGLMTSQISPKAPFVLSQSATLAASQIQAGFIPVADSADATNIETAAVAALATDRRFGEPAEEENSSQALAGEPPEDRSHGRNGLTGSQASAEIAGLDGELLEESV